MVQMSAYVSEAFEKVLILLWYGDGGATRGADLFEVGGVMGVFDGRFPWNLSVADIVPVKFPKP
jgi:hypothetical protein